LNENVLPDDSIPIYAQSDYTPRLLLAAISYACLDQLLIPA